MHTRMLRLLSRPFDPNFQELERLANLTAVVGCPPELELPLVRIHSADSPNVSKMFLLSAWHYTFEESRPPNKQNQTLTFRGRLQTGRLQTVEDG